CLEEHIKNRQLHNLVYSLYSLSTGERALYSDDADEILAKFSKVFNVSFKDMQWNNYFPQAGIPFIPNCLLPKHMQTDHNDPLPLTINMLIASAKAGRWLYD
ncbi:DUF1493 family protein, partial [Serratia rubidaea]|uniref:DUF1493 family protein n=1 Tax=Serratia rubidaea TaxID=61652 RepID=UPI003FA3651D